MTLNGKQTLVTRFPIPTSGRLTGSERDACLSRPLFLVLTSTLLVFARHGYMPPSENGTLIRSMSPAGAKHRSMYTRNRKTNNNATTAAYLDDSFPIPAAAAAAFLASSCFFASACQEGSYRYCGFVPSSAIVRLRTSRESSCKTKTGFRKEGRGVACVAH